jgi:hypothetical protein
VIPPSWAFYKLPFVGHRTLGYVVSKANQHIEVYKSNLVTLHEDLQQTVAAQTAVRFHHLLDFAEEAREKVEVVTDKVDAAYEPPSYIVLDALCMLVVVSPHLRFNYSARWCTVPAPDSISKTLETPKTQKILAPMEHEERFLT